MKYTNKQIKRILSIQEFISMSETLSKTYKYYDSEECNVGIFTHRDRIYRIYCASIYNLIKAIQDSKEFFINNKRYNELEETIKQEYVATNNKYYSKENYKATLLRIIETIRNQVNHSLNDEEDNNILFAAYIDFEILENLRRIIVDIYSETYSKIDKAKIKKIILNKPRIKYSLDIISNKIDELKLRIPENENRLNRVFKTENEHAIELYDQLFNPSNLYDAFTGDPDAIRRFVEADREMQQSYKNMKNHIKQKGSDMEKESLKVLDEYFKKNEKSCIKDTNKNIDELKERLLEIKEKYNS